ncbi:MAG: hypothetical protein PHD15_06005 [Clostridia bacterium]|nr:hypothetical protein [Clostridia bacterium]MDD4387285.1 hypothetical protein [Clostridia bacterium]
MTVRNSAKSKYKRKSDYWIKLKPIKVYRAVVNGKLKKFPNNYMTKDIAETLVKSVIIDQLKFSREDICKKLNFKLLSKHHLGGVRKLFNDSLYSTINYVFKDEEICEWELNKVFPKFWDAKENRVRFILWIAKKEKLDITKIEDARKFNANLIIRYGGSKMLKKSIGLHSIINEATDNLYKEWQFVKINVWTEEKVLEAVKWLIEEKLKWSEEEVCNSLTAKIFYDNDLGGLLSKTCGNSPIKALEKAYPGRYKKENLIRGEKRKESLKVIRSKK